MTYNVFSGTLNPTQSVNHDKFCKQAVMSRKRCKTQAWLLQIAMKQYMVYRRAPFLMTLSDFVTSFHLLQT